MTSHAILDTRSRALRLERERAIRHVAGLADDVVLLPLSDVFRGGRPDRLTPADSNRMLLAGDGHLYLGVTDDEWLDMDWQAAGVDKVSWLNRLWRRLGAIAGVRVLVQGG